MYPGACVMLVLPILDLVYKDKKTPREKQYILKRSFQHFSLVALDIFWFSHNTRKRVSEWVSFEKNPQDVVPDKACVCITGHLGNWEVLGHAVALHGYALASVATPLKNPVVNDILIKAREATGQSIIPRKGAIRSLLKTLTQGGMTALLLDQNTHPDEGGIFIDVFGVPATVSPAGAMLATRTQAEILFGFCIPQPNGHYMIHVPPTITPPPYDKATAEKTITDLTCAISATYETVITTYPECWLWMYKRWKNVRPGDDITRYPFYSSRID